MNLKYSIIGIIILIVVVLAVALFGSNNNSSPNVTQNQTIPINQTINNSKASVIILDNVVDANNLFAQDLYSKYSSKEGNIFVSPYSITSALAMTYEGAKGKTAEEMQAVLHIPSGKDVLHSEFLDIYEDLNKVDKEYNLSVANALWAQKDFAFLDTYFNDVERYYDGKVTNLDFLRDRENSRLTINHWVENKTNDKIKDLIPEGVIKGNTVLVLTNAIYFKANWSNRFMAENTEDEKFKLDSSNQVDVEMMHQKDYFNYSEDEDVQILEMDYLGNDLSMLVILPKDNNLSNVEKELTKDKLNLWKANMSNQEVAVSLPKFKFESKYFMAQDLKEMGMPTAFDDEEADFTGMYDKDLEGNVYIDQVIHQTFIEVAEYGTEAAAATAVIMGEATGMPRVTYPKVFKADHPFIFIIQQKKTGNILFMGRLSNPSN